MMQSFFAIVGGGVSLVAILMAMFIYTNLPNCGQGKVAMPIFGKGIYCVDGVKWSPAAEKQEPK